GLVPWSFTRAFSHPLSTSSKREPPPGKPVASLLHGIAAVIAANVKLHRATRWHQADSGEARSLPTIFWRTDCSADLRVVSLILEV
ncbi:MAG: hypothetical protein M3410_13955, partial [Acidobacteriota bacterium]|nr:hypothetical protein [Acidobacteriota bacterium]